MMHHEHHQDMPAEPLHSHVHQHADGTFHNHFHAHEGGGEAHEHGGHGAHAHGHGHGSSHEHGASHEHTHGAALSRTVLRAENVEYAYPHVAESVFKDISVEAKTGSVLAILGNNGAGKSTLLNLLAGITQPKSGQVLVGERPLSQLSRREAAQHIAYVAQQQRVPHTTVYDSVMMGRKPHVSWAMTDRDRQIVASVIDRMGISAFSQRCLDELSGGERQKVYIARALAQETEVLLLDEPTSALDPKNQLEVLTAVKDVTVSGSLATVLVIHDINLALRFCDRFLLVRDGIVVAQGGLEVVTDETLFATYDIHFHVCQVGGVPVAIPV